MNDTATATMSKADELREIEQRNAELAAVAAPHVEDRHPRRDVLRDDAPVCVLDPLPLLGGHVVDGPVWVRPRLLPVETFAPEGRVHHGAGHLIFTGL